MKKSLRNVEDWMKYLFPKGKNNPMWKGGRSISSNGYVLIRVGSTSTMVFVVCPRVP